MNLSLFLIFGYKFMRWKNKENKLLKKKNVKFKLGGHMKGRYLRGFKK